ncbi:MAG: hypothetical protein K8T25_14765 [Planctomycetia bacterium]|nr:hypothetical protein [Planctomycetia bacterium]
MRALVVTDNDLIGAKLSSIAQRCGVDCDPGDITPLDAAADAASRSRYDLVMLVVPEDRQRALAVLPELRHSVAGIMLVVGAADDPKFILRVLREGAHEFVDLDDVEIELEAALNRLRTKQQVPDGEQGQVIGILGCGGGSGASTLAVNIAAALAIKHRRAALLDLRLSAGDQALLLDLKPTHTLGELCLKSERMDAAMFQQVLTKHDSGVQLLAAPSREEGIAQVTASGVRQVVALSRSLFPFTVMDLDSSLGPEQLAALVQADVVFLALRLDMMSLCSAQRLLDQVGRLGVADAKLRVVVNRFGQPKELPAGKAEKALGVALTHYVPDDPATINSGNNKGVPVVIERPTSKVARSLVRLALSVHSPKHAHAGNGHHKNGQSGVLGRWWSGGAAKAKK